MSSKKEEIAHVSALKQLLADTGVECLKTVPESSEASIYSGEFESKEHFEEHSEIAIEETVGEEQKPEAEDTVEELPELFPSRSLRRVLPERVREIEQYNAIHVLPEKFHTDIDPEAIPKIASTAHQVYIDTLAKMVGCESYMTSLAEFWFLDTLANLLRRAQEDKLDKPTQAILILWFCEWMKEIQHFDAADRQRMLKRFQDNMLSAARFVGQQSHLPTPAEAAVHYQPRDAPTPPAPQPPAPSGSKHLVTFEGTAYECSLKDLTQIIHYIYDLFSTDYQYELVRSVFTFPPEYVLIDAPNLLQTPKKLYQPPKVKAKKEKSPKKESKGKGKKKEVDTEEYLALLQFIAKAEREQEELEEQQREEWNRRNHILPLNSAAGDLWQKYWPLPPPPEAEPEVKPKAKKGKK